MSAPIAIDKFVENYAKAIANEQKFLSYFHEIYDYYIDKMPDNKYIYYLDENPVTKPAQSLTPEVNEFFELNAADMSLLTPEIRIYKSFKDPSSSKLVDVEFPFENKMDFDPFKDPRGYFDNQMPFVSERFAGNAVGLQNVTVKFEGAGGKADWATANVITVDLEIFLQDAKMLLKNLHDTYTISYKDLFGEPSANDYKILMEIGYNIPDNYNPAINKIADQTMLLSLNPIGALTTFTYNENGSMTLKTSLSGYAETQAGSVNLLSTEHYRALKGVLNMQEITQQFLWTAALLSEKRAELDKLKNSTLKTTTASKAGTKKKKNPSKKDKVATAKTKREKEKTQLLQKDINYLRKRVNLAKQSGATSPVFPFIAVLHALGKIYYIEMEEKAYKEYMTRVAKGEVPVDTSTLNNMKPKPKAKIEDDPNDIIGQAKTGPAPGVAFNIGGMEVKRMFTGEAYTPNTEKIKFFYLGDLLNIILNDQDGGGVGQQLDRMIDPYHLLLGTALFVVNEKKSILYNIANTPISVDLFVNEINKLIIDRRAHALSLRDFIADFLQRYFNKLVFQSEKEKSGQDRQFYTGEQTVTLSLPANYTTPEGRIIKSFSKHATRRSTKAYQDFMVIRTKPFGAKPSDSYLKKLPTLLLGGPDKGPLLSIKYTPAPLAGMAEEAVARAVAGENVTSPTSVGTMDSSVLISHAMTAEITLKGNPFYSIGDWLNVNSKFVDGGFFNQQNSLLFFSGQFSIFSAIHTFSSNQWTTTYSAWVQSQDAALPVSEPRIKLPTPAKAALAADAKQNASGGSNEAKPTAASPEVKKAAGGSSKSKTGGTLPGPGTKPAATQKAST